MKVAKTQFPKSRGTGWVVALWDVLTAKECRPQSWLLREVEAPWPKDSTVQGRGLALRDLAD